MKDQSSTSFFDNREFKSIIQLVRAFPDEQTCIDHLEKMRWNGNVVSPFDPASKVWKCANNRYHCKNTGKYFNVKTGTMMDNTKVLLQKWFMAVYLITGHKKGISSAQLARDLDVTQKTAWFMLQRIRNCFGITNPGGEPMGGEGVVVEVDETFVGGKVGNMHVSKRKELAANKTTHENKTKVMGYVERGGNLRLLKMRPDLKLPDYIFGGVDKGSVLMTDASPSYQNITKPYAAHFAVDHDAKEYARDSVIHTNTLEGAFSLFDRMVIGIYHYVSPKHIEKYLNEFCFRYNSRKATEYNRFNTLLSNCGQRLKYSTLIAK